MALEATVDTREPQARLERLYRALQRPRAANRAASVALYGWTLRNYDSEGGLVGGWAPLAESTVKRKARLGKERMLVITGAMRASVLPFHDDTDAGVGTAIPYSAAHQLGNAQIPARPFLPDREEALSIGINVYGEYIQREISRQGLR